MSVAHKIAAIIVIIGFMSLYLRSIRRTAEYEDMLKWDHVAAAYFMVLIGFIFASRLGLLYSIPLSFLLGLPVGLRWARMRIKRSVSEDEVRLSVVRGIRIPMKLTILPLPFALDCFIAVGCIALGVLLELGVWAIVDL